MSERFCPLVTRVMKELSVLICLICRYLFIANKRVVLLQLITDEAIIAVSENCVGLRCLGVSRCSRLTDAALVALGQTCTELQYVCWMCYYCLLHDVSVCAVTNMLLYVLLYMSNLWCSHLDVACMSTVVKNCCKPSVYLLDMFVSDKWCGLCAEP